MHSQTFWWFDLPFWNPLCDWQCLALVSGWSVLQQIPAPSAPEVPLQVSGHIRTIDLSLGCRKWPSRRMDEGFGECGLMLLQMRRDFEKPPPFYSSHPVPSRPVIENIFADSLQSTSCISCITWLSQYVQIYAFPIHWKILEKYWYNLVLPDQVVVTAQFCCSLCCCWGCRFQAGWRDDEKTLNSAWPTAY